MSPLDLAGIPLGPKWSPENLRCPNCGYLQEGWVEPIDRDPRSKTITIQCNTCDCIFEIDESMWED